MGAALCRASAGREDAPEAGQAGQAERSVRGGRAGDRWRLARHRVEAAEADDEEEVDRYHHAR